MRRVGAGEAVSLQFISFDLLIRIGSLTKRLLQLFPLKLSFLRRRAYLASHVSRGVHEVLWTMELNPESSYVFTSGCPNRDPRRLGW